MAEFTGKVNEYKVKNFLALERVAQLRREHTGVAALILRDEEQELGTKIESDFAELDRKETALQETLETLRTESAVVVDGFDQEYREISDHCAGPSSTIAHLGARGIVCGSTMKPPTDQPTQAA